MSKIKKSRRKKPNFLRLNLNVKRLDISKWRKPKGMSGRPKKSLSHKKGKSPKIGYGLKSEFKNKHMSGMEIVEISNIKELENLDKDKQMAKILNVGKRKKIEIVEKAILKGIKISNLREPKKYIEKTKKK